MPMPSVARISASRSKGGSLNSVKTSPRTSTRTRSQITRSDSSSLHSSTPAPLLAATSASELSSSSFDATSTPRVGVIATMSDGLVRERPRDGDLLLVAAGQLADRLGRARTTPGRAGR